MSQSHTHVEWTIVENDAEWERLSDESTATDVGQRNHALDSSRLLWRVAALLSFLTLLNGWTWNPSQSGHLQAKAETALSAPITIDNAALELSGLLTYPVHARTDADWQRQFVFEDELLLGSLWPHESINQLRPTYQVLMQQEDHLVVNVSISTTLGQQAYRQTRFYVYEADGWQRIAPEELLWGAAQQLTTSHFHIAFRKRDEATVTSVAAQIETLYTTMRRNFGLPLMPLGEKLGIDVSVTQRPGASVIPSSQHGTFLVTSPAFYLVPVEVTDEQFLAQVIVLLLLEHLSGQADEYYAIPSLWQPLENGLRLWQLWDLDLPLAVWQEAIVQWLYTTMPTTNGSQRIVLPLHYKALCQSHQLWLANPWQIFIPLECNNQHNKFYRFEWGDHQPPVRLGQLAQPMRPNEYAQTASPSESTTYLGQTVALATLIEYAVATYGQERLPTLLAALRQYEQWTTLIPAVYGVSAAEFEGGWRRYLAAHYGVDLMLLEQSSL